MREKETERDINRWKKIRKIRERERESERERERDRYK